MKQCDLLILVIFSITHWGPGTWLQLPGYTDPVATYK